jgi:ATP-binding cassette subfamily F protein uup
VEARAVAEVARPSREAAARAAPPPAAKPRLSFKDKHALETLPARIAQLDREIATLQAQLADPGLYARDPAGFAARSSLLGRKQAEREAAEEEWLRLELLREELEG